MRPVRNAAGAALLLLLLAPAAFAEKGRSEGSYVDAAGTRHAWQVNPSHALLWDGAPYTPAGVVFHSHFLAQASEANFGQDRDALKALRDGGIQDIWIDPGRGLTACAAANLQRLVDLVESDGFRYGLAIRERTAEPFSGYTPPLDPFPVPEAAIKPGGRFHWTAAERDASRVHYALVDADLDLVIATGTVPVENGAATIDVTLRRGSVISGRRAVLYLVPERQIDSEDTGSFPDLWGAVTAFQQRLVAYLKGVRFGPGLRFLMDPIDTGAGLIGAESDAFPATDEYRGAFQEWLVHQSGINDINIRWGLTQTHMPSMEVAARLVPTWPREDPPDGPAWLVDPVDHLAFQVIARRCHIWSDYDAFRADSLKRAMSQLAAVLRGAGPCVPVVYTWSGYQPLFDFVTATNGYDGIAPTLRGSGTGLAIAGGGAALSQAEHANANWWLVAGRVTGPENVGGGAIGGAAVAEDWAALRDVGYKGFYVDPGAAPPGPEVVAGLRSIRESLGDDRDLASYRPKVCYFPALIPNAGRIARLPNGAWWLPATVAAREVRLGSKLRAYVIQQPFGPDKPDVESAMVIWSPTGQQQATFAVNQADQVKVLDGAGAPVKIKSKKKGDKLPLPITDTPLVVVGIDPDKTFPVEAASTSLAELDALIKAAEAERLNAAAARQLYDNARQLLSPTTAGRVYQMVRTPIAGLRQLLSPYQWIEGERAVAHNFSGSAFQDGASEGRYLLLDKQRPPKEGVYYAKYKVDIFKEATYQVWVAGRVPGRPGVSPLQWSVDNFPTSALPTATPVGDDYAAGFCWYSLGSVTLERGHHMLTLAIPARAGGDKGRYQFGIDAILLSRAEFQPRGAQPPEWNPAASQAASHVAARP